MCLPCVAPWLAVILAALGLENPELFAGPIRLVLAALATFRLVDYLGLDDGPFGIYFWVREKLGVYERGANGLPRTALARMLACPHCIGLLVGSIMGLLALCPSLGGDFLTVIFAVAGAQSLLHSLVYGQREGWNG